MAKRILITGNTFPVKDQIKALGGKWDADAKGWKVPEDKAKEAQALVDSAPAKVASTEPSKKSSKKYFAKCHDCGASSKGYYRCYSCSLEYRDGGGMHKGGMSYRDSNGNFVLGDDD